MPASRQFPTFPSLATIFPGVCRSRSGGFGFRIRRAAAGRRVWPKGLLLFFAIKMLAEKQNLWQTVFSVSSTTESAPGVRRQRFRVLLQGVPDPKKLGNKNQPLGPLNPLKSLKTDEKSFGKVWRFQAENLEMFGKSLEKAWEAASAATPPSTPRGRDGRDRRRGCAPRARRSRAPPARARAGDRRDDRRRRRGTASRRIRPRPCSFRALSC